MRLGLYNPIQTRSKALLEKYVRKLGVELPKDPKQFWQGKGQTNPFYCAMVEMLDYYVGQLVQYLEQTDDPRWPGHKLIENTYIIFTSDNGGWKVIRGRSLQTTALSTEEEISLMEGALAFH